jgi:hypothetical protein
MLAIGTVGIVLLVIIAILIIAIIALYILGRRMQKKEAESQSQMEAASQSMTFYIIDMKRMKFKDANLPKIVMEQTPKYARRVKLPILKVKVGPRVMSLICDPKVFDTLAPKQEVKAKVSGIYVTSAKRVRGPIVETDPKKRKEQEKAAKKAAKAAAKGKKPAK